MARFNLAQLQSLFLLGSFGDWLLTRKLIERVGGNLDIEANPIAQYLLWHFGIEATTVLKIASVCVVSFICWWIAFLKQPEIAVRIMRFASIAALLAGLFFVWVWWQVSQVS